MKRFALLLLSFAMVSSLAACQSSTGNDADNSQDNTLVEQGPSEENEEIVKTDVILTTGLSSSIYYAICESMESVLNPTLQRSSLHLETAGSAKTNLEKISDGEASLALVPSDALAYAHHGLYSFSEEKNNDALWVAGLYDEPIQIVASPEIKKMEDIRGKKVFMGDEDSAIRTNVEQILEAYEMTADDVIPVSGTFQLALSGIANGKVDVAFTVAGLPTESIANFAQRHELHMLSLSEKAIKTIQKKFPFLQQSTLPANTYQGLTDDVSCVSLKATLVASKNMSEKAVYELAKKLFEQQPSLAKKQERLESMTPESSVSGATVSLHPGAEKYYQEINAMPQN